MSIRRTITILVLSSVLLVAVVAAAWSYWESSHELEEVFDAELAEMTRVMQGLVRDLVQADALDRLRETLQLPQGVIDNGEDEEILPGGVGHKYEKKIAFQVWSPQGKPLVEGPASHIVAAPLEPGYAWISAPRREHAWRVFTLRDPETGYWIRAGQRGDIRGELAEELALGNVAPLLMAIPLVLLFIWAAIYWGFRPLARLERPIRRMAPEAIHALDESESPQEVRGLVRAVNGLLFRLQEALEHERQFTADAAHELRTPLAALRLNLERQAGTDPERYSNLFQAVDRMVHLVEQMLVLSRVDPEQPVELDLCNLESLASQALADLVPFALKHDVEPALDTEPGLPPVPCNPHLMTTLIRNLVNNAIQYSPAGTTVTVSIRREEDSVLLTVTDAGPGIPLPQRQRALERFSRLDQRRGAGAGAGLGLAIVKRIVELHKGELGLDDRPDGQTGLMVTVRLPLSKAI
ncbi:ATP-binding protein [Marinobacteraceae bacterium S3BR75-40.1]